MLAIANEKQGLETDKALGNGIQMLE